MTTGSGPDSNGLRQRAVEQPLTQTGFDRARARSRRGARLLQPRPLARAVTESHPSGLVAFRWRAAMVETRRRLWHGDLRSAKRQARLTWDLAGRPASPWPTASTWGSRTSSGGTKVVSPKLPTPSTSGWTRRSGPPGPGSSGGGRSSPRIGGGASACWPWRSRGALGPRPRHRRRGGRPRRRVLRAHPPQARTQPLPARDFITEPGMGDRFESAP